MQPKTTNKLFPDVRTKIWYEAELHKLMQQYKLLEISENDQMIIITIWNAGIQKMLELGLEDTPE